MCGVADEYGDSDVVAVDNGVKCHCRWAQRDDVSNVLEKGT